VWTQVILDRSAGVKVRCKGKRVYPYKRNRGIGVVFGGEVATKCSRDFPKQHPARRKRGKRLNERQSKLGRAKKPLGHSLRDVTEINEK